MANSPASLHAAPPVEMLPFPSPAQRCPVPGTGVAPARPPPHAPAQACGGGAQAIRRFACCPVRCIHGRGDHLSRHLVRRCKGGRRPRRRGGGSAASRAITAPGDEADGVGWARK
eukprot:scaffold4036_cov115-Isochrysis_galbana.AAC.9